MANNSFYNKCANANLVKILREKGYTFFENGIYDLNIIGIRSDQGNQVTNLFDDYLVVLYKATDTGDKNKDFTKKIYKITTEPGEYYMSKGMMNPKGTAILAPGQYRKCWMKGLHRNKYSALVQTGTVKVYRDNNKDKKYDLKPETLDEGIFGINLHRANKDTVQLYVGNYSAGCQVFADPNEFESFMRLCELQIKNGKPNSFTYTLLEESDLTYSLTDTKKVKAMSMKATTNKVMTKKAPTKKATTKKAPTKQATTKKAVVAKKKK